jgi:hypothetical protein
MGSSINPTSQAARVGKLEQNTIENRKVPLGPYTSKSLNFFCICFFFSGMSAAEERDEYAKTIAQVREHAFGFLCSRWLRRLSFSHCCESFF